MADSTPNSYCTIVFHLETAQHSVLLSGDGVLYWPRSWLVSITLLLYVTCSHVCSVHAAAFLLAISDSNSVLRLRADTGLPAADL